MVLCDLDDIVGMGFGNLNANTVNRIALIYERSP